MDHSQMFYCNCAGAPHAMQISYLYDPSIDDPDDALICITYWTAHGYGDRMTGIFPALKEFLHDMCGSFKDCFLKEKCLVHGKGYANHSFLNRIREFFGEELKYNIFNLLSNGILRRWGRAMDIARCRGIYSGNVDIDRAGCLELSMRLQDYATHCGARLEEAGQYQPGEPHNEVVIFDRYYDEFDEYSNQYPESSVLLINPFVFDEDDGGITWLSFNILEAKHSSVFWHWKNRFNWIWQVLRRNDIKGSQINLSPRQALMLSAYLGYMVRIMPSDKSLEEIEDGALSKRVEEILGYYESKGWSLSQCGIPLEEVAKNLKIPD